MLALLLAVSLPWPAITVAHPLHTAVAEINYDQASRTAAISIRVFADDLAKALNGPAAVPDSAIFRYLRGTFALSDRSGRPLLLHWVGFEQAGDVVLLRLQAPVPAGLAQAKVLNAVLSERFQDQVNIVRATYNGRVTTLLFTPGDPAKTLP